MIKRIKILRICPGCKKEEFVRKDGVGIYCRSCKAKINSKNKTGKYLDITNNKYGRLLVLEVAHKKNNLYFWKCICDCSNIVIISGNRLRSGKTKSCGCILSTQKNLSTSSTYRSWHAMKQRCYDTKVSHYKRYGALGIIVCDRWKNSFLSFLDDMGERPIGKTLDRINVFGNYELSNCRWATYAEQAKNKRKKNK